MESLVHDWVSMFVRAAHIVAAIGWIGSSFYFMWLDASLRNDGTLPPKVKGESWSVHGGGFYEVRKYMVAPDKMPTVLHWFRWESYSTWMTGFVMLAVTYWWGAKGLLISADSPLAVWEAIAISGGSLVLGWLFYDNLCKSPLRHYPLAMFAVLYVVIMGLTWAYGQVFTARAAWLHTGAFIATMMSGNVFLVIIPNQRKVVASLERGEEPDGKYGQIAKLRSTHNNYLTLPVIAMMISNHYPIAFGHPYSWVLVGLILGMGAVIRHFFNSHDAGKHGHAIGWQWPVAFVLLVLMMWFSTWRPDVREVDYSAAKAIEIVHVHCAACHSATPTSEYFEEAPAGIMFDNLDEIRSHSGKMIAQAVLSDIMPLGNETGMTEEERAELGSWLRAGAPSE